LLVFFDFAGKSKPSWQGQSSYSLVDNHRVRGAKIAGFISLDLKPERCVSNPPKSTVTRTFRKIGNPSCITLLSEQISTSHQQPAKRTGCLAVGGAQPHPRPTELCARLHQPSFFCTRRAHHPRAARSTVVARFPVVLATRELHHCRRRRASVLRRPEGRSSIVSFSAVGGGLVHTTGLHLQLAQLHLSLAWCPSRYLHPRVAPVSCPCR
jgi:hypothetical protein